MLTKTAPKAPVNVTITSVVDPMWIELVTSDTDIFGRDYCSYWLRGMARDSKLGWLAFDHGGEVASGSEPNKAAAKKAWRAGEALPKDYFRLDIELAKKAWGEGVTLFGVTWYENGDGPRYDRVIQRALFGGEKYG